MNIFKCKHPFKRLAVAKDMTSVKQDRDFNSTTYHLLCRKCGAELDLNYAEMMCTTEEFLSRAPIEDE